MLSRINEVAAVIEFSLSSFILLINWTGTLLRLLPLFQWEVLVHVYYTASWNLKKSAVWFKWSSSDFPTRKSIWKWKQKPEIVSGNVGNVEMNVTLKKSLVSDSSCQTALCQMTFMAIDFMQNGLMPKRLYTKSHTSTGVITCIIQEGKIYMGNSKQNFFEYAKKHSWSNS